MNLEFQVGCFSARASDFVDKGMRSSYNSYVVSG
jgi:hypothetical protein